MSALSTLFMNVYAAHWADNVSLAEFATFADQLKKMLRFNVNNLLGVQLELDNDGVTYAVGNIAAGASTDWHLLAARVVGDAYVTTTGTDAGGAAITGKPAAYGTEHLPGLLLLSTYRITAAVATARANDTVIELISAQCAEDS